MRWEGVVIKKWKMKVVRKFQRGENGQRMSIDMKTNRISRVIVVRPSHPPTIQNPTFLEVPFPSTFYIFRYNSRCCMHLFTLSLYKHNQHNNNTPSFLPWQHGSYQHNLLHHHLFFLRLLLFRLQPQQPPQNQRCTHYNTLLQFPHILFLLFITLFSRSSSSMVHNHLGRWKVRTLLASFVAYGNYQKLVHTVTRRSELLCVKILRKWQWDI